MSRRLLAWVREVLSGDRSDPPDSADPEPVGPRARLFECPNCETTYIGVVKETCSRCDGPVRRIPSESDLASFQDDRSAERYGDE